ncbi:hypothetical protein AB0M43_28125 [Longispora sp. NPDC051575]|uniref:bestrophin-like domain n=1 Tax=Longispora sp. NPDC051575 TaxID=3154943 RepID=UPI00341B1850
MVGILAATVAGALLAGGATALSRGVRSGHAPDPSGLASGASALISTAFVLLLAVLVVNGSQARSALRQATVDETQGLRAAYVASAHLAWADREDTRARLRGYSADVVRTWPRATDNAETLTTLRTALAGRAGGSVAEQAARAAVGAALDETIAARGRRASAVPPTSSFLLAGAVGLALATVGCHLLVGWPTGRRYTVAMGLLGAVLGFLLAATVELGDPYGSTVLPVRPTAYAQLLAGLG